MMQMIAVTVGSSFFRYTLVLLVLFLERIDKQDMSAIHGLQSSIIAAGVQNNSILEATYCLKHTQQSTDWIFPRRIPVVATFFDNKGKVISDNTFDFIELD